MGSYRIADARKKKGWSQQDLADALGTSQNQIYLYESGKRDPKTSTIVRMAELLDTTVPFLLGINAIPYEEEPMRLVPVLGRISAGTPSEALQQSDEYHEVRESIYNDHPKSFYLVVSGNSMNRLFVEGSLVLVDPEAEYRNGDVVAVFVNGDDATLKRIYMEQDKITLVPESFDPEYKDRVIYADDPEAPMVRVLGKVVTYTAPKNWRA